LSLLLYFNLHFLAEKIRYILAYIKDTAENLAADWGFAVSADLTVSLKSTQNHL